MAWVPMVAALPLLVAYMATDNSKGESARR